MKLTGLRGWSWAALGVLGHMGGGLGTYVGGRGPLLSLYRRSWAALGAYLVSPYSPGGLVTTLAGSPALYLHPPKSHFGKALKHRQA